MTKQVQVDKLPPCNFCGGEAEYDAKTWMGPWAYMCMGCFAKYSVGKLGTGLGQRLVLKEEEVR